VSLVVSRKAITKYQLLFRHLFYTKHVERQLCTVWQAHKQAKWNPLYHTKWHAAAFCLRQRMLSFINNYSYYSMFEVIERQWHIFTNKLKEVKTLDELLIIHNDFLETCLKDCMLTTPELLRCLAKLMSVCVNYCNAMQRLIPQPTVSIDAQAQASLALHTQEQFECLVTDFDDNFTLLTIQLLLNIQNISKSASEHHLSYLLSRLDPNNFYQKMMEDDPELVARAHAANEPAPSREPTPSATPAINVENLSSASSVSLSVSDVSSQSSSRTAAKSAPPKTATSRQLSGPKPQPRVAPVKSPAVPVPVQRPRPGAGAPPRGGGVAGRGAAVRGRVPGAKPPTSGM